MKKLLFLLWVLCLISPVYADDTEIIQEQSIQNRVNNCGMKILNSNKIQKKVIFAYDKNDSGIMQKFQDKSITSHKVILYGNIYKNINDDNELAAFLAREISKSVRSYDGMAKGWLRSLQIKAAPKKYEIVADKTAVDYMVKADYNPVALIVLIQKTEPQKRFDKISRKNLASKRTANIYEYIYTKYPYYLKNNAYIKNENYQNFLLTSVNNRKMLEEKIETNSKKVLKYE